MHKLKFGDASIDFWVDASIWPNGQLHMIVNLADSNAVDETVDFEEVLGGLVPFYTLSGGIFKNKKDKRELEVMLNKFERSVQRALRNARKDISKCKILTVEKRAGSQGC